MALEPNREVLRLELGRVGKTPRLEKLCTDEARDLVLRDLAYRRSLRGRAVVPAVLLQRKVRLPYVRGGDRFAG